MILEKTAARGANSETTVLWVLLSRLQNKAFSFVNNSKKSKQAISTNLAKRNSSRKSNGYSKKSHSFSITKKFKGFQRYFKGPSCKMRHHNQTPNNQISAMMSIKQQSNMKNNKNSRIHANKSVVHHSS